MVPAGRPPSTGTPRLGLLYLLQATNSVRTKKRFRFGGARKKIARYPQISKKNPLKKFLFTMAHSILVIFAQISVIFLGLLGSLNALLPSSGQILPPKSFQSALIVQNNQSSAQANPILFHSLSAFCSPPRKRLFPRSSSSKRYYQKRSTLFAIPHANSVTELCLIVSIALIIGVAAQWFINSMVSGDRGLGAFLSDGSGFNRSNFKPVDRNNKYEGNSPLSGPDPLPWLKLPKLSYVEVAGQEKNEVVHPSEDAMREVLQSLAEKILYHVKNGELELAKETEAELEQRLEEFGFEYSTRGGT